MINETETQSTAEVVEQLEEEQIDLKVVRWVAGEGKPPAGQRKFLDQLRAERSRCSANHCWCSVKSQESQSRMVFSKVFGSIGSGIHSRDAGSLNSGKWAKPLPASGDELVCQIWTEITEECEWQGTSNSSPMNSSGGESVSSNNTKAPRICSGLTGVVMRSPNARLPS